MAILLSVVIPTYNRSGYVKSTIESFLNQDYVDFEILVIDDGSTDDTRDIVEAINDKRVHYFYKKNEERGVARNYGAARAKGKYVTFFDSDDIVYPWYLSHASMVLNKIGYPECYAQAFEFKNSVPLMPSKIKEHNTSVEIINSRLLKENFLACNGVFIRRDVLSQFGFSENRKLSGSEDWFLWLQLSCVYKFYYSPVIGSCLVNHEGRGELNIKPDKLEARLNLLLSLIKQDKYIGQLPKKDKKRVLSSAYFFAANKWSNFLKYKKKSAVCFIMGAILWPKSIFSRNTLVYFKRLLLSWNN